MVRKNDYGLGFYCTQDINLAMEWSVDIDRDGYINLYDIDETGLSIMNLNDSQYSVLNWISILINNRDFQINSPIAAQAKRFLLDKYLPDYEKFDIIRGYRADDSYFSFARDFLNNTISLEQLSAAMHYGNLGEQIVLKSKEAFDRICYVENADSATVMGKSGIGLCYDITGHEYIAAEKMDIYTSHAISGRSREYWTGWTLAYYQWNTSLSYAEINDIKGVDDIASMYDVYHEMDISHFVERINEIYRIKNPESRFKKMRQNAGLSQSAVSELTGIPLKTIQQYEQRRKNINNASVDYLISLSRVLKCDIELLVEKV